jgi:hypothetical protein
MHCEFCDLTRSVVGVSRKVRPLDASRRRCSIPDRHGERARARVRVSFVTALDATPSSLPRYVFTPQSVGALIRRLLPSRATRV